MYVCVVCVAGTQEAQKRALDPRNSFFSYNVGAGDWTWFLSKSSKYSYLLNHHLSNLLMWILLTRLLITTTCSLGRGQKGKKMKVGQHRRGTEVKAGQALLGKQIEGRFERRPTTNPVLVYGLHLIAVFLFILKKKQNKICSLYKEENKSLLR